MESEVCEETESTMLAKVIWFDCHDPQTFGKSLDHDFHSRANAFGDGKLARFQPISTTLYQTYPKRSQSGIDVVRWVGFKPRATRHLLEQSPVRPPFTIYLQHPADGLLATRTGSFALHERHPIKGDSEIVR